MSTKTLCMFRAALFIIAKKQKQAKCPSTDKWITKMWSIYIMVYLLETERNKVMMIQHGWILDNLLYVKEAKTKSSLIIWFHLYEISGIGKSGWICRDKKIHGCPGLGSVYVYVCVFVRVEMGEMGGKVTERAQGFSFRVTQMV